MSQSPPRPKDAAAPRTAVLAALGVVFGDLGTSPLYTLQTVVGALGGEVKPDQAMGVLSLIFWALIVTISVKYCLFVMRADNHGEGGILALMSLVGANSLHGRKGFLAVMGLIGAALIYGDGIITPAISVLSALEGVKVATSDLTPYVVPAAVVILLGLFAVQRFGTAKIGRAFGPIMLIWFAVVALLGIKGIVENPAVLAAVDPRYGIHLLATSGFGGLAILGGVFLAITGGEALYADMGHFGRVPIRYAWFAVVLPALLLSYAGQTALLIRVGKASANPFFELSPGWAIYPLTVLATLATIIASQAIITGAFSLTRQAMQLGWLPGFKITQTSEDAYGQIYVPFVNWTMMAATLLLTVSFQSSDRLAGAYGTAVSTTMLLTTGLLYEAMTEVWHWRKSIALPVALVFVIIDLAFFVANLLKIFDGGWVPLSFGAVVFGLMLTWRAGAEGVHRRLATLARPLEAFVADLAAKKVPRVPGTAAFLTRANNKAPALLVEHVRTMGALHETVIVLTVLFEEVPHIAPDARVEAAHVADGVWRAQIRFGFLDVPNLPTALGGTKAFEGKFDLAEVLFFGGRDLVVRSTERGGFAAIWIPIFAFLFRNAVKMVDRFDLPPRNAVEIVREIEI